MNTLIDLALVCAGIAAIGAIGLIGEWIGKHPAIRKAADKLLSKLPLMGGD